MSTNNNQTNTQNNSQVFHAYYIPQLVNKQQQPKAA